MNLKLKKGRQNLRASDFVIVLLVTMLVIFGVVMVFSASYYYSINSTGSPYGYLKNRDYLRLQDLC